MLRRRYEWQEEEKRGGEEGFVSWEHARPSLEPGACLDIRPPSPPEGINLTQDTPLLATISRPHRLTKSGENLQKMEANLPCGYDFTKDTKVQIKVKICDMYLSILVS